MSQPVDQEYPNSVMTGQPNSSHSNGSFGPVFAILAVIVVISAIACVLGRLCSKRSHRAKKEAAHHPTKASKGGGVVLGPKEWESRQKPSFMRDGDIEFGFDKKPPSSKGGKNGGGGKMKPPPHNGGHKPEIRFSDNV